VTQDARINALSRGLVLISTTFVFPITGVIAGGLASDAQTQTGDFLSGTQKAAMVSSQSPGASRPIVVDPLVL
jgi:hypothetical protein